MGAWLCSDNNNSNDERMRNIERRLEDVEGMVFGLMRERNRRNEAAVSLPVAPLPLPPPPSPNDSIDDWEKES